MTYFLWTIVALFTLGAVSKARGIASGQPEKPAALDVRVTAMLIQVAIAAWAFFLLLVG